MYKLSTFRAQTDHGYAAVPLFGPADAVFEKVASASLLPDVLSYISTLKPIPGSQYVLVSALGAGEFYGSNSNGDHFEEAGLIHKPDGWTGNPLVDQVVGKQWTYGFPTFYGAKAYAHHQNKDPGRAYGDIELAVWNESMKRVELVCRVDRDKCEKFGGVSVWDKLHAGQYADVSMGAKVCYDLSSVTTDWALYREALATHDPKKYAYPGLAVVEFHKKLKAKNGVGIKGLSITRKEYDEWTLNRMNKILPDGRKVWVYNPYPKFFDISFVFIGADKTAKTMVFIARGAADRVMPSAEAGEKIAHLLLPEEPLLKVASIPDSLLSHAFGKTAVEKNGEITKEIPADVAVPLLEKSDKDLPEDVLGALAASPLQKALGTTAAMGIVLKPQEFQSIVLRRLGRPDMAEELAAAGKVFPRVEDVTPCDLGEECFSPSLARLLLPLLGLRSALGPYASTRVVLSVTSAPPMPSSHNSEELRKIGAAYNGYREALLSMAATAQDLLPLAAPLDAAVVKLAAAAPEMLFTPTTVAYMKHAHLPPVATGVVQSGPRTAGAMRGAPLQETRT